MSSQTNPIQAVLGSLALASDSIDAMHDDRPNVSTMMKHYVAGLREARELVLKITPQSDFMDTIRLSSVSRAIDKMGPERSDIEFDEETVARRAGLLSAQALIEGVCSLFDPLATAGTIVATDKAFEVMCRRRTRALVTMEAFDELDGIALASGSEHLSLQLTTVWTKPWDEVYAELSRRWEATEYETVNFSVMRWHEVEFGAYAQGLLDLANTIEGQS